MVVDASSSLSALYLRRLLLRLVEADKEDASVRCQTENTTLVDHQIELYPIMFINLLTFQ